MTDPWVVLWTSTEIADYQSQAETVAWLMTPEAIRRRCFMIYETGLRGQLNHFEIDMRRLDAVTEYIQETITRNYPDMNIPYHARWRHFVVEGDNRWQRILKSLDVTSDECARIAFDLVIISVLLDAGAGDTWLYRDPKSGQLLGRSEGLAIASLNAFEAGLFSSDPTQPLRADMSGLLSVTNDALAAAFQVNSDNPLPALNGRVRLINRLGIVIGQQPEIFGTDQKRIGCLFDHLKSQVSGEIITARQVLATVMRGLGAIWPGRITLDGVNLGDTWQHPAARADNLTGGLVPFHKLSQWIVYSLIEPLEAAGLSVTGIDDLTVLAEYRNGGLLFDFGVVRPKHDSVTSKPHACGDEVIVEWRALTVTLIELAAERLRAHLGLDTNTLPLAKILEGGTWAAGRQIAHLKRIGGGPPIRILSNGSVF